MKKLSIVSLKIISFFLGWAICTAVIPIPDTENGAVWRFLAELLPFLLIVAATLIFWLIENRKIQLHIVGNTIKSVILGIIIGVVWLGTAVLILYFIGAVHINGYNHVSMLWLWIISVFINTVMQEMLVRGYIYQIVKSNYNTLAAVIVSTALFTFLHGGAFEAGIIPVLNVMTMSLFVTAVMEYTGSLVAPIIIHFIWNCIGAVILGGVSLADDYPNLFNMTISGNPIISGGDYKIEGSIVVLILNLLLIFGITAVKKKKC